MKALQMLGALVLIGLIMYALYTIVVNFIKAKTPTKGKKLNN